MSWLEMINIGAAGIVEAGKVFVIYKQMFKFISLTPCCLSNIVLVK